MHGKSLPLIVVARVNVVAGSNSNRTRCICSSTPHRLQIYLSYYCSETGFKAGAVSEFGAEVGANAGFNSGIDSCVERGVGSETETEVGSGAESDIGTDSIGDTNSIGTDGIIPPLIEEVEDA